MNGSGRSSRPASDEFADRVMAAIAGAPPPTPTRSFLSAVRVRAVRSAAATLWVAWHLATVRGWRIGPQVRARSMALVLGVAAVLGTGSLAAAAAVHEVAPRLMVSAPASDRSGSQAEDPRVVAGDPSETAGPSETRPSPSPNPSPKLVVPPVVPVPRATPGRTETRGGTGPGKRPAAAKDDGDDVGTGGEDRSDDRDPPSSRDGGDDQSDKTDGGDGASNGGDHRGTDRGEGSGG
jgi:hypothetical protein